MKTFGENLKRTRVGRYMGIANQYDMRKTYHWQYDMKMLPHKISWTIWYENFVGWFTTSDTISYTICYDNFNK